MRIANICICDENELYLQSVQKYLLKRQLLQMRVQVFNSIEKVQEYSDKEPFDLILVNEKLMKQDVSGIKTKKLWVLQETKQKLADYPCISKFQSMEKLLDEVVEAIADLSEEAQSVEKAKLLFFFETQKTREQNKGFEVARLLTDYGKKVLYLNLSAFASFDFLPEMDGADVTDLIYYLLKETGSIGRKLELLKKEKNQVDLFLPALDYQDLLELSKENWSVILTKLLECTEYDFLVLECTSVNRGLLEIYDTCVTLYMPLQDKGVKDFQKLLERKGREVTKKLCLYESMDMEYWKGLLQKNGHIKTEKSL